MNRTSLVGESVKKILHFVEQLVNLRLIPILFATYVHQPTIFHQNCGVVGWCDGAGWGILLIWIIVGQGPTVIVVGADGSCLDMFSLVCHFSLFSPSLWETALYRLNTVSKGY